MAQNQPLLRRWKRTIAVCATLAIAGAGCRRAESEGEAPPVARPNPVDPCGQMAEIPMDGLPGRVAGFCLDPNADVKRYGEGTSLPLDAVCVELFNGECEIYKRYGLGGVKTTNYISAKSPTTSVAVVVSNFQSSAGAYGFFTRRVVGDGLPSQVTVKPLKVPGRAALGPGVLYLWRGKQVVEMNYVSELETPEEIIQHSATVLGDLALSTSSMLLGNTDPPATVLLLEDLAQQDFGVVVFPDGLLGQLGSGPYAVGYFEREGEGKRPYRLLVAERRDEASATDLVKGITRGFPSKKLKDRDAYRVRFATEGKSPESVYVSQDKERVLLIQPLELGESEVSSPDSREREEKAWEEEALRRLRDLKKMSAQRKS